ncbi:hypothetical protein BLOT_006466 [Blomia tropicalis]|nr:hypothetical protein BLOT_006466 [Blomia tropicalis]
MLMKQLGEPATVIADHSSEEDRSTNTKPISIEMMRQQHYLENIPEEEVYESSSYESSIDMFANDDHLSSCEHPLHFDDNPTSPASESTPSSPITITAKQSDPSSRLPATHISIDDECDFDREHTKLTNEIELIFQNISHQIGTDTSLPRQILDDISGHVSPGQVLALMGPSGSGKTTLLNLLSGRVKPSAGGCITLNGTAINKQLRRRICYVLQQDIFFANLTLRQTLMYSARLRLPQTMKHADKVALVDKLIDELHLNDCQHTVIGDFSQRGLSGGEKKRVNIACELLTNPSVMLIDEPTSGLDSCTAHGLVQMIKNYAMKKKKTIIMSVHQPSSQMFYMFDQLLLLSNGKLSYFGHTNRVVSFFNNIGLTISSHYNPADFILEKIKNPSYHEKIVDAAKCLPKLPNEFVNSKLQQQQQQHCSELGFNDDCCWKKESLKSIELSHVIDEHHNHQHHTKSIVVNDTDSGRSSWSESDRSSTISANSFCHNDDFVTKINRTKNPKQNQRNVHAKWPTSIWTQIQVLTERNFIEAKHRMLSKLNWIQTVALAIIAGLIWFRPARTEDTIEDIRGWMFFTTTYWMLFGLFQALVSFPSEREVINKERSSGAYRLSSYYIAKMIGELPLTIALPSVFFFISYPLMGYTSAYAFIAMWLFLIVSTICAQSVGLFIGAACYDLEVSVTTSALYSLSTMLFAGYYTSMPPWLSWARYFSMVYYAFLNMQMVEFSSAPFECSKIRSKFASCQTNGTETIMTIPFEQLEMKLDIMNADSRPFPIWFNTIVLLLFLVIFRTMGYLVLRYGGRKSTN